MPEGKSERAYRTIGEASEEVGVPAHVLRFWETKFHQIRPLKRSGGRRFYRPQDLALIQRIKTLLHEEGLTIKGVQKLLREQGLSAFLDGSPPRPAGAAAASETLSRRLSKVADDLAAAKARLDAALDRRA